MPGELYLISSTLFAVLGSIRIAALEDLTPACLASRTNVPIH